MHDPIITPKTADKFQEMLARKGVRGVPHSLLFSPTMCSVSGVPRASAPRCWSLSLDLLMTPGRPNTQYTLQNIQTFTPNRNLPLNWGFNAWTNVKTREGKLHMLGIHTRTQPSMSDKTPTWPRRRTSPLRCDIRRMNAASHIPAGTTTWLERTPSGHTLKSSKFTLQYCKDAYNVVTILRIQHADDVALSRMSNIWRETAGARTPIQWILPHWIYYLGHHGANKRSFELCADCMHQTLNSQRKSAFVRHAPFEAILPHKCQTTCENYFLLVKSCTGPDLLHVMPSRRGKWGFNSWDRAVVVVGRSSTSP